MGRRSSRESYTSKGERPNVSRRWLKLARKDRDDRLYNQWNAFVKGKKVMLTIANPNTNETNKRFITEVNDNAESKLRSITKKFGHKDYLM